MRAQFGLSWAKLLRGFKGMQTNKDNPHKSFSQAQHYGIVQ